ncbi:cytochrome c oxidase subunit II [Sphingomonas sp. CARO-RG-8B-R24-01]|uniref:cytochrome c oxidase subunit II n=1 Tax=Sphingomonas sp. CARO-RG-8B-R24-01 TaxID=2914831 RepID=UPI001F5AAD93|nr:cytochrome c oxidase subunit II [Sphingomonas sp. CARO-RG-8B-R24-01]
MIGFKSIVLAAGLAMVATGAVQAAPQAAPVVTVSKPEVTPAPAAAAPATPSAATDPMLAVDGAPAMGIDPNIGQPVLGHISLQPQVTKTGRQAAWFHNALLMPVITVISLFVLALLGLVIVRFRRAANPVASKTSHNTILEVAWTGIPVLILLGLALPSIGLLQAQYKPAPKNAVVLKAIGNQWYWSYEYPGNGGFSITSNMLKEADQVGKGERARAAVDGPRLLATDNRVVLPVGQPIRLITTSNDVIHSWEIPAFWIKLDAIPGRLNETSFTIEKPGVYFGVCSELCGARHGYMPITVEAVPPAVFAAWVKAKGGTMPANGAPAAPVAKTPSAVATGEPTAIGNAAAAALPAVAPVAGASPVAAPAANASAGN